MKKALFALFSMLFILLFVLIFFTLQGHAVRHMELENALELSMKQAMNQLQFDEGAPISEEKWLEDFSESIFSQIESESDLTVHIYEADMNKGLLSAQAVLTYQNFIGAKSSVSTEKRTVLIENFTMSTEENNFSTALESSDTNLDGVVDTQEATDNISTSEQAMLDAGYGNVALLPTGNYGVLMTDPDHFINGKDGGEILTEYLSEKGIEASSISGSWMNNQYYNWIAKTHPTAISYTNAKEFYESTALDGQNYHAEMVNGTIYYATVAKKASSNTNLKYTSIGSDVTLSAGGQSLTFSVKIGQSLTQIQSANVETSTYIYHLYTISTEDIYQLAMAANPNTASYIFNCAQINVLMNTIMTTSQNGNIHGSIRENGKGGLYEDGNVYHLGQVADLATMKHIFSGHNFSSYINIQEKMNNPELQLRYQVQGLNSTSSTTAFVGSGFTVINGLLYENGSPYIQNYKIFQQTTLLNPHTIQLQKAGYHLDETKAWTTSDGRVFSSSTIYMPKDLEPNIGTQNYNLTLYANWQPNSYTVIYDANGGGGTIAPTAFSYDESNYLRLNSFYRTGYYLPSGEEWNTKPDGTGISYGSSQLVKNLTAHNGDQIVLYANWKPIIVSITTDKQGGSGGTDTFYEKYNTAFSLSTDFTNLIQGIYTPAKTGYHFLGYFRGYKSLGSPLVNTNGALEMGSNYFVQHSRIYADWKAKQYIVTFDKQGGSGGTDHVTSTYDQRMPLADAPAKTGFSFQGYYTEPNKKGSLYYNEYMASDIIYQTDSDITLYACWLDDILPDVYLNSDKKDWTNQTVTLTASAYDYGLGLESVKIYVIASDGALSLVAEQTNLNGIPSTTLSFENTQEGITRYKAVATDLNGNTSESYNVAYFDTKSPTGDCIEVSENGSTYSFKINVTDINVP